MALKVLPQQQDRHQLIHRGRGVLRYVSNRFNFFSRQCLHVETFQVLRILISETTEVVFHQALRQKTK